MIKQETTVRKLELRKVYSDGLAEIKFKVGGQGEKAIRIDSKYSFRGMKNKDKHFEPVKDTIIDSDVVYFRVPPCNKILEHCEIVEKFEVEVEEQYQGTEKSREIFNKKYHK